MKKRWILILSSVIVASLVLVGVVYAFSMVNVDGVWETTSPYIDTNGALCDSWASGPTSGSTSFDSPDSISYTDPSIQGTLGGKDWNQVRYGSQYITPFFNDCYCEDRTDNLFSQQSGFAFDGVDDVVDPTAPYYVEQAFLLGKWCHINKGIYTSACNNRNDLDYVDLDIRVGTVRCDPAADNPVPSPDDTMDFTYRFDLDETPNTPPCPYLPGNSVNDAGCADAVTIGAVSLEDTFTCTYGEGTTSTDYTIQVLGFVPLADPDDTCPATPAAAYSSQYISREDSNNCACLYAKVTDAQGTAVELDYFTATEVEQAVEVKWETTTELDNLGFNLYRNREGEEAWVKLNEELIPTVVYPGAPFGGKYSFVDADVEPGQTYSYWLMDVDFDSISSFHGPAEVTTAE